MHLQRSLAILKEKISISLGSRIWKVMIVTMMSSASALVIIPCFFLQGYWEFFCQKFTGTNSK